jgi:solute carrier family 25 (mitochondrial carnitine/acylcarnitine transporter), member 20/29
MQTKGRARHEIEAWRQGLFGALAGYALWIMIYPIDVVKSKLQLDAFDPSKRAYRGIVDCVRKTVASQGMAGLFRGFGTVMLRAGPVNGATFIGYEVAMNVLGRS